MKNERAFPVSTIDGFTNYGMTLLDYVAIHMARNIMEFLPNDDCFAKHTAQSSYEFAKEFLKEKARLEGLDEKL